MLKCLNTNMCIILAGIAANNYVYLHDLLWNTTEGWILLGPKSYAGIILSVLVILYGIRRMACPEAGESAQSTGENPPTANRRTVFGQAYGVPGVSPK
jgi:hypothetical protein